MQRTLTLADYWHAACAIMQGATHVDRAGWTIGTFYRGAVSRPQYWDTAIWGLRTTDTTWSNDACPSIVVGERFKVWIDYDDPDYRECFGPRFTLCQYDGEEIGEEIISSDDPDAIEAAIHREIHSPWPNGPISYRNH